MADDEELMIVRVTRKNKRRRRRRSLRSNTGTAMPDTSFTTSADQGDCWIIGEQKETPSDSAELIVLDSVESDEDESVTCKPSTPNGHVILNTCASDNDTKSLLERIKFLEEENYSLKFGRPREDGSVCINSPSFGPSIQVTFADGALAQKYRSEVEKLLCEISTKERKNQKNQKKAEDSSSPSTTFVVDKVTAEQVEQVGSTDEWAVPVYNQDFGEALQVSCESETITVSASKSSNEKCFNCNGCHFIKDCPEKYDQRRISENKRRHYGTQLSVNNKKRMGNEKLWQLKYKPGHISDALRNALSLRPIQIPGYIYMMRVLGYPPGWLKEAEIERSKINIYDSDGNVTLNDDNEDDDREGIKASYDPTKLIDYPGFNVDIPADCVDEHLKLGLPAMQLSQQRTEVEKHMTAPNTAYQKKKTFLHPKKKRKSSDVQSTEILDMEIDDTTTISSDENSQKEHLISSSSPCLQVDDDLADQSQGASSQESSRVSSPTLTDLEERKIRLIKDLEAASQDDSDSQKPVGDSASQDDSENLQQTGDCACLDEVEISVKTPARGATDSYLSKSVTQGTPVLSRCSPFHKLPEPTVFSAGISEHKNFENLPDATGCYDKLRGVLNKVRDRKQELRDS